jgi:hypothetical protein
VPISFDTSAFEQRAPTAWLQRNTGDQVGLDYFDIPPDLPAPLDDVDRLRRQLAFSAARVGGLIEAHVVVLDGLPAVLQIVKVPLPDRPAGQFFLCSFIVPRAACSAVLKLMASEGAVTGVREAQLAARLGFENWVRPHPYAPEVQGRLPFHAGDDPRFDAEFPDHPLSRARAWAHHVVRTARVDPRFASQPPFTV